MKNVYRINFNMNEVADVLASDIQGALKKAEKIAVKFGKKNYSGETLIIAGIVHISTLDA